MDLGLELYQNVMGGQQSTGFGEMDKKGFGVRDRILSWNRKEMKTDRRK